MATLHWTPPTESLYISKPYPALSLQVTRVLHLIRASLDTFSGQTGENQGTGGGVDHQVEVKKVVELS